MSKTPKRRVKLIDSEPLNIPYTGGIITFKSPSGLLRSCMNYRVQPSGDTITSTGNKIPDQTAYALLRAVTEGA